MDCVVVIVGHCRSAARHRGIETGLVGGEVRVYTGLGWFLPVYADAVRYGHPTSPSSSRHQTRERSAFSQGMVERRTCSRSSPGYPVPACLPPGESPLPFALRRALLLKRAGAADRRRGRSVRSVVNGQRSISNADRWRSYAFAGSWASMPSAVVSLVSLSDFEILVSSEKVGAQQELAHLRPDCSVTRTSAPIESLGLRNRGAYLCRSASIFYIERPVVVRRSTRTLRLSISQVSNA